MQVRDEGRGGRGRLRRGHAALGCGVLLLRLLDALVHVAAGGHQVVVGILDLVLVELHLRADEVELILQVGLVGLRRLAHLLRQGVEGVGVGREALLCLIEAHLDGERCRT